MEKEIEEMAYEEAFQELNRIVNALETNESTLEESLALFSRGQALTHRCQTLLDQAELKIKMLINGEISDYHLPAE